MTHSPPPPPPPHTPPGLSLSKPPLRCYTNAMIRKRSPVSLLHRIRVDAHAAWLAARDPRTPWHARLFGLLITAYALSPIDLIPDFIPVLGLLDDVILIPLGIWLFVKMLPPGIFEEHRVEAAEAAERPGSAWGAAIVVTLWILAALLTARLLGFDFA